MSESIERPPSGCRYCGIAQDSHGERWTSGAGVHRWTQPRDWQILHRMRARRLRRWL